MGEQKPACACDVVEVDDCDALCCPPLDCQMWNAHPRVYLSMPSDGDRVHCYYCGTLYVKKMQDRCE